MSLRNGIRVFVVVIAVGTAFAEKKYKDQGEYDAFDASAKAVAANDFRKAITSLDSWSEKYPESDFQDDRLLLYVQAFAGAREPGKALDAAAKLTGKDLDSALGNPGNVIKLLFTATVSVQQVPAPSPTQLATGDKAARKLLAYDKKPDGVSDADWAQPRKQLQTAANAALLHVAMYPGRAAMQKNDCKSAEVSFEKALEDYPDSAQVAWFLGTAQICLAKTVPEKTSAAIYSIARAAAVDANKGMVDPKWQETSVDPYLQKIYGSVHGADPEGLKNLKELAARSPRPPAGFKIESVAEIAHAKELEFEKSNPQLSLWMKIKGALSETNGEQYFASNVKDAAIPQLKGVLVEAKPACRPKELLIAVPLPDSKQPHQAEIALKLDKALTGKPAINGEVQWEGVPTAFSQSPFLLTMETETAKIEGLQVSPCAVPTSTVRKKK